MKLNFLILWVWVDTINPVISMLNHKTMISFQVAGPSIWFIYHLINTNHIKSLNRSNIYTTNINSSCDSVNNSFIFHHRSSKKKINKTKRKNIILTHHQIIITTIIVSNIQNILFSTKRKIQINFFGGTESMSLL